MTAIAETTEFPQITDKALCEVTIVGNSIAELRARNSEAVAR